MRWYNETAGIAEPVSEKRMVGFREGGNHTIVTDGKDVEAIPRHKEISENLAKALIKRRNLK